MSLAVATARYAYVGTYQQPPQGIVVYSQDQTSGKLQQSHVVSSGTPSSLAAHPTNNSLFFGIHEYEDKVSSYSVKSDGNLQLINTISSGGKGPAFVKVHTSGRWLLIANYDSGHFSTVSIGPNGRLSPGSSVKPGHGSTSGLPNQKDAHAHMITTAPNGQIAGVDLGSDAVFFWKLSLNGQLKTANQFKTKAGTGPRHIVFHEGFSLAYAFAENANNINVFRYNETNPQAKQVISTLPAGFNGKSAGGEIRIHPNKKFIYASNRGADTIVLFSIQNDGTLKYEQAFPSQGKFPRGMNLDPTGSFLYVGNQNDNSLVTFKVGQDGRLTFVEKLATNQPVDIEFFLH